MKWFSRSLNRGRFSFFGVIILSLFFVSCEPETILLVNQTTLSVSSTGGSTALSFSANKAWTASSDQSWCKVSPSSGVASENNSVSINVTCEANTTYDPRSCTITIQCAELSASVSVEQRQSDGLFVSKSEYDLSNEAHRLNVEVKTNIDLEVISNVDWIQYVETKALKTSTIVLDVAANEDYDPRTGTVVVRQKGGGLEGVVTIRQDQNEGLFVSPIEINVSNQAAVVDFKVDQNVAYDVVIPEDAKSWISIVGTKGLQTDAVSLSIAGNPTYLGREASVIVKQCDGSLNATVKIVQEKTDYWAMDSAQDSVGYAGGEVKITVITNEDYRLSIPDFATWITVGETLEEIIGDGLTKYTHILNIASNNNTYSRSVAISFVVGSRVASQFIVYQGPDSVIEFKDAEVKRTCVEHWDLNKDGELSCTEASEVTDVTSFRNAFSRKDYTSFDEFSFFTGIDYVPDNMFKDWFLLESICLPKSIQRIGAYSFMGCSRLKTLDLPESVQEIGYMAFRYCSRMESIHIPRNVTSIGHYSFWDCPKLSRLYIDDLEQWLKLDLSEGGHPFCSCDGSSPGELYVNGISASSIEIPEKCAEINDYAFYRCTNIQSVKMHDEIYVIGKSAFKECENLTSVVLPKNLSWIRGFAFCNTSLTNMYLPEGLYEIEDCAFASSNLASVSIPNSVLFMGKGVFSYCQSLSSVVLPEKLEEIPSSLFAGCGNLHTISIPETVTTIGADAFKSSGITSISIPSSVQEIKDGAFCECSDLNSIIFNEGLLSVGNAAFSSCFNLHSVELPYSIEMIGGWAFWSGNLIRIVVKAPIPPDSSLDGQMFGYTDCPILVPAGSVDAYKAARYWSDYADQIRAIESSGPEEP